MNVCHFFCCLTSEINYNIITIENGILKKIDDKFFLRVKKKCQTLLYKFFITYSFTSATHTGIRNSFLYWNMLNSLSLSFIPPLIIIFIIIIYNRIYRKMVKPIRLIINRDNLCS